MFHSEQNNKRNQQSTQQTTQQNAQSNAVRNAQPKADVCFQKIDPTSAQIQGFLPQPFFRCYENKCNPKTCSRRKKNSKSNNAISSSGIFENQTKIFYADQLYQTCGGNFKLTHTLVCSEMGLEGENSKTIYFVLDRALPHLTKTTVKSKHEFFEIKGHVESHYNEEQGENGKRFAHSRHNPRIMSVQKFDFDFEKNNDETILESKINQIKKLNELGKKLKYTEMGSVTIHFLPEKNEIITYTVQRKFEDKHSFDIGTLESIFKSNLIDDFSFDDKRKLSLNIMHALRNIHDAEVVHGNITPENILIHTESMAVHITGLHDLKPRNDASPENIAVQRKDMISAINILRRIWEGSLCKPYNENEKISYDNSNLRAEFLHTLPSKTEKAADDEWFYPISKENIQDVLDGKCLKSDGNKQSSFYDHAFETFEYQFNYSLISNAILLPIMVIPMMLNAALDYSISVIKSAVSDLWNLIQGPQQHDSNQNRNISYYVYNDAEISSEHDIENQDFIARDDVRKVIADINENDDDWDGVLDKLSQKATQKTTEKNWACFFSSEIPAISVKPSKTTPISVSIPIEIPKEKAKPVTVLSEPIANNLDNNKVVSLNSSFTRPRSSPIFTSTSVTKNKKSTPIGQPLVDPRESVDSVSVVEEKQPLYSASRFYNNDTHGIYPVETSNLPTDSNWRSSNSPAISSY